MAKKIVLAMTIAAVAVPAASAELPTFLRVSPPGAPGQAGCASGAFLLPQTTTCLVIGGAVRADLAVTHSAPSTLQVPAAPLRTFSASSLRSQGELRIDARTPTAAGPVRTYVSIRAR